MVNILFVCTENKLRSATAEVVFSTYEGVDAIGAGTNQDAPTPVSGDLIEWADVILVMEQSHRNKISKKYPQQLKGRKLAVLGIPDNFIYMDPELIRILKMKVPKYVRI